MNNHLKVSVQENLAVRMNNYIYPSLQINLRNLYTYKVPNNITVHLSSKVVKILKNM